MREMFRPGDAGSSVLNRSPTSKRGGPPGAPVGDERQIKGVPGECLVAGDPHHDRVALRLGARSTLCIG